MASQLITIPDNYIWNEEQAKQELAKVLADAAAGAPQPYTPGSRSITDTYRSPQEMAALYPMNAVNEQVGLAGATGYKVPGANGRSLFDILQAGDAMAAGKMAPGFQTAVSQSLTGETPSEIGLRGAQARHLNAQTADLSGTNTNLTDRNSNLVKTLGTDKFDAALVDEVAKGNMKPSEIAKWNTMNNIKTKAVTPTEKQQGTISAAQAAYDQIDNLQNAFHETDAYKTGKGGESLKLALALSSVGGQAFDEAMGKLTPADRTFVAHANVAQSRLRQLAGAGQPDAHFSNYDAKNAIRGIGSLLPGSAAYDEQLSVFKDDIANRQNASLNTMSQVGRKDISGVRRLETRATKENSAPVYEDANGNRVNLKAAPEVIDKALKAGKYKRVY